MSPDTIPHLKDENPHQGPSVTFGKPHVNAGEGEHARPIETKREEGVPAAPARREGVLPVTSPFTMMRHMAEDMDRIFQNFGFGRLGALPWPGPESADLWAGLPASAASWSPQVETFRRGDTFVVRADLPGLRKEDVDLRVEESILTISGERLEETKEERDDYFRSERSYGRFHRSILLPEGADAEHCNARFEGGVLEVTVPVPKAPEPKTRRIAIR